MTMAVHYDGIAQVILALAALVTAWRGTQEYRRWRKDKEKGE